ncbi:MAG TPA: hypothetical protein VLZ03_08635, partial [Thermodesulfobacteriota bacterium]|nr:hypothetical protein [Thermodesulfobacteriota bacterium]
ASRRRVGVTSKVKIDDQIYYRRKKIEFKLEDGKLRPACSAKDFKFCDKICLFLLYRGGGLIEK